MFRLFKQNKIIQANELPTFKYHPDPLSTGVIIKKKAKCPVCKENREFSYVGPFYSVNEVANICPWCISNGTAANKLKGEFQDIASCEKVESKEYIEELIYRTPGYCGWQQEQWLSHCGDFCAFIGYVGWQEIKDIANELKDDLDSMKNELGLSQEEIEDSLMKDGSLQGYLFRCLKCGKHRLAYDMN